MGRRRLLSQYQPTAGVNADFEKLLQQFTATETVRFEKFSEIWRELKMSFIFAGRDSERECREYTEEMMRWALKYLLPPYNFQVRVGGLYLLYGLFNQQPLVRKVRIRVTPEKWKEIIDFQTEARRQQHLDVNYVFQRLRFDDAFCYTATETEVTFNLSTGTSVREEDTAPEEFKDEQSVLYDLFSEQFLEQLTQLHDHYHNVKVGLEGPDANEPSRSLNVIQTNIVPSLLGTVMAYQQRKQHLRKATVSDTENDDMNDEDYKPSVGDRGNIKSEIKAKAYRNVARASRSRRHRQAVDSADDSPDKQHKRGRRRKNKSESEATSPKRKKGRKKNIKKEAEDVEEHMEGVQSPTKSDKSIGEDNLHTRDQEINKSDTNQEKDGERETSQADVLLHMPSFDTEPSTSGTQQSSPKKKLESPKVKKKAQKRKGVKGRMPSVKLQPLEKKTKGKTKIKKETMTEEKT